MSSVRLSTPLDLGADEEGLMTGYDIGMEGGLVSEIGDGVGLTGLGS